MSISENYPPGEYMKHDIDITYYATGESDIPSSGLFDFSPSSRRIGEWPSPRGEGKSNGNTDANALLDYLIDQNRQSRGSGVSLERVWAEKNNFFYDPLFSKNDELSYKIINQPSSDADGNYNDPELILKTFNEFKF